MWELLKKCRIILFSVARSLRSHKVPLILLLCSHPCLLTERSGACAGLLKGVGEESARSAGSEATAAGAGGAGAGGAAPGKFLTALYAKPIGYQYRRFKTVD